MALLQCSFRSKILDLDMGMHVILPHDCEETDAGPRVLYLLHGLSDDQTAWQRRTSIERYVQGMNLAVIMPTVHRSFYSNTHTGYRYMDFMARELPELVGKFFRVSDRREDTYIAGLSMGGYGAFKLALTYPERYTLAASFSGALDVVSYCGAVEPNTLIASDVYNAFGPEGAVSGSADDLLYLARRLAKQDVPKPRLLQYCGTEDFLYQGNIWFRDCVKELGFDYSYSEGPGDHVWEYWDARIADVLREIG